MGRVDAVPSRGGLATILTRAELIDMIWRVPAASVAPTLGLSDVGLAKICKKHAIPRPGRGYWARKAAGKPIPIAVLPPCPRPELETIVFNMSPAAAADAVRSPEEPPEIAAVCRYEADPRNRIEVPAEVGRYHPMVALSRATFK